MKIELEFTDPKEGLPEDDGHYIIYYQSNLNLKVFNEECFFDDGGFSDHNGYYHNPDDILLWAKMPNYDELIKNKD